MRLDKFLCDNNIGTRSQVKEYIKKGQVTVNDQIIKKPETKVNNETDTVVCQGQTIHYRKYVYYMLNKPEGVVSATNDNTAPTVVSLLTVPEQKDLFPVGRLDKDTTGLLLLTNDGALAHDLLSPKKHVDKTYLVKPEKPLSAEDIHRLENGLDIGDEKPTAPSKARLTENGDLLLTIHEGRFHQVKRMLQAVDNQVLTLERVSFGPLSLDLSLQRGEYRALTEEEIKVLSGSGKKSYIPELFFMQFKRMFTTDAYRGTRGYLRTQKIYEILRTVLYFAISLSLFIAGWVSTGSRENLLTIVAVLGCLPACKSLVEMFMFLRYRGCDEQVAAKIAAHTEGLTTLYDMVFTSYEKNYVIYHLTVCGNTVCGYTTDPKFVEQAFYKHIQDILKKDNYREVSVKIFNDLDKYLARCDQLKELSSQPELSAGICQTLKSVSL